MTAGALLLGNRSNHDLRITTAVAPIKMNMLYIGVDNPLEVAVSEQSLADIEVSISQGTLEKKAPGLYVARPEQPGTATITTSIRKGDREPRPIDQKVFRVSRIPDPIVLFGNHRGPVITAREAKSLIGLVAQAQNFPFDAAFTIRSFDLSYQSASDGSLVTFYNVTGILQDEARQLLTTCKAGDRIWFNNIKVAAPDGTTRTADLSFKVVGG
jgi:hypothetical protein